MKIRIDLMELAEIISKLPTDSYTSVLPPRLKVIDKYDLIEALLDWKDEHEKGTRHRSSSFKTIRSGRYADAFVMKCGE